MMKEDDVHPFPRSNNSFTRLSAYAVHSRGIFGLCSADLSPLPSFLHYCVVRCHFWPRTGDGRNQEKVQVQRSGQNGHATSKQVIHSIAIALSLEGPTSTHSGRTQV